MHSITRGAYDDFVAEMDQHLNLIPGHIRDGVREHCLSGRPNGSFVTAVLSNDLMGAVSHGDPNSIAGLKGIVQFLHNYGPQGCWGTPAKAQEWKNQGGLLGLIAKEG